MHILLLAVLVPTSVVYTPARAHARASVCCVGKVGHAFALQAHHFLA